ncbi:hypothetical protein ISN44_Un184g000010 [Arabidopsis suecica]|uniref:Senescence-associated protein n=1 Tax=Arabidopsis suecica TaxID=45249 RepID=A0A8T1XEB7_ARASU|nr:hypothetical protein ISN44_Un184g000010 [Arabidopsis suecica]
MSFGGTESLRVTVYNFSASEISTGNLFTNANKATNAMSRVRYATQAPDPIIERNIAREVTEKDRWLRISEPQCEGYTQNREPRVTTSRYPLPIKRWLPRTSAKGKLDVTPRNPHDVTTCAYLRFSSKPQGVDAHGRHSHLAPTRDSLGGSMLSNEARPSNLGGWNRCPWGHLGISGAFRIYRHPRPRRIHVSPCHDTPILFGDGVKRCPWGHLGIPCAFPIYRHPKASKNPCHPTHDTPILRDHTAIFVRELLKKLKNCDKTDRRKSRRKNFPAIIPAVGRSDSAGDAFLVLIDDFSDQFSFPRTFIVRIGAGDASLVLIDDFSDQLSFPRTFIVRIGAGDAFLQLGGVSLSTTSHQGLWGGSNLSDKGLNLSGSWQQGHSATYNTPSERRFRRTDLANDTCLWEPKLLLRVGNRAAGACVASSPDSDLEAFSHNPAHGSFAPLAFQPSAMTNSHVPYWWVNNPTLGEFCFTMIGRADIEGSKSNVAMNAWLPQASYPCGNFSDTSSFKFRRSKGSIGHAFTVRIRTENQNQTSFYPFVPHEISVLVELILGHLRYLLTDVPPQPNSPPDNVLRPDRPAEASLGSKNRGCTPPPTHGSFHKVGLESSSTGSSFPADSAKPVPLAVVSLDSRQGHRIPLVRTSSELTVRRPGKAPERAVPSPSPGRHAATRSRRGSSSSSPPTADGFGTGTPEPSPQSQSFSRSYGSILPTSLAYIVPSTRGCSPWRPDAVMSTTGRERHSVLRIFKGRRGRTGHHATCGALPAAGPYLRLSRFQDLHRRPLRPGSRPRFCSDRRALLLIEAWLLPRRPGIGRALQRHPFSGLVDSADERFARQYRCGPPPEFPLASPRSGIVHHLSGPDRHAHTRTLLRRSRSVGGAPARDPANQLPCALRVYSPVDSHTCQTPWSVFQDGSNGEPTGRRPEHADAEARRRCRNPRRSTPRIDRRTGLLRSASDRDASPAPIRFPPDNFKHSLTLFSKSFSSLPRGTCSLSVSRPYLALDGIYRPIGAAFPNNPTRRQRLVVRQGPGTTGLSPSLAPLSRELRPGPSLRTLLQTTIRTPKTSDFQAGLFPVRSPLLRESLTLGHLQLPDRSDRQYQMDHVHHRMSGRSRRPWLGFRPTACGNTRETSFRPASAKEYRGRRFVTPRQTCPRPEGLGRNLRSKTRWFTGFCNSHQVSHFATFFIDARAEISVAESRFRLYIAAQHPRTHRLRGGECQPFVCLFLDTFRRYAKPRIRRARDRLRNRPTESGDRWFAGRSVLDRFSGLLATSRAANHPRRRDPNTSPDHSIGRSDGRQIAPPTKNGHAPPPIESRKSSQSVNPYYVWTCNSAGGTTRPIKTRSVSPTEGTSRPVHTKGGPADPSQGRMSFGGTESLRVTVYNFSASEISTGNLFTNANKATNAMSRVRYATQAPDPIIERNIAREVTEKDRWLRISEPQCEGYTQNREPRVTTSRYPLPIKRWLPRTSAKGKLDVTPRNPHDVTTCAYLRFSSKPQGVDAHGRHSHLAPTRDSLGGSMLSNEARPSNLGGWNRCPWGHLGISGAFRIYRHPRPRRIHVSPCHDTPILFGDGVKRCPWGHLGIPCAFPIYRHPKASKNPCHPTHDTPILRDHTAIFVRELLKKLKNCDKTDRRKSRRKNFPAIIPAVGRSDSLSVMPPDNIPRSLPTSGTE